MLPVFYNSRQSTDKNACGDNERTRGCESPSAGKPAILVQQWLDTKQPIQVVDAFEPVTREQLYQIHDQQHVDDILLCKKDNGFYNRIPEVAATLPWTSGSMLAAARYALENKTVAMSPTSGFHHAEYAESMGFCTFNGLMLAAYEILKQIQDSKTKISNAVVGILDLDHHYGNGTDSVIDHLVRSNKIQQDQIHHYTFGGDSTVMQMIRTTGGMGIYWKGETHSDPGYGHRVAEEWLDRLPDLVASFKRCDIVLYQAGADPHVDDPHGGALTDDQLQRRDVIVFETLRGIPLAWNLAGGYQTPLQKVLDIHTRTLEACNQYYLGDNNG